MSNTTSVHPNIASKHCLVTEYENNVYVFRVLSSKQEAVDEFMEHLRAMYLKANESNHDKIRYVIDSTDKMLPIRRILPAIPQLVASIPYASTRVALIMPSGLESAFCRSQGVS